MTDSIEVLAKNVSIQLISLASRELQAVTGQFDDENLLFPFN